MFERDNQSTEKLKAFDIKSAEPVADQTNTNQQEKKSKKGKIIIAFVVLAVLLALGIVYNIIDPKQGGVNLVKDDASIMFLALDEITVNLRNSGEGLNTWLRIKVSLELQGESNYDIAVKMTPKIVDVFQTYLKELRKTDLDGSFGIYKMKDEMTMRINTILYPNSIRGIFFQEIIVQTN